MLLNIREILNLTHNKVNANQNYKKILFFYHHTAKIKKFDNRLLWMRLRERESRDQRKCYRRGDI